jgi:Abortive infection alpha
MSGLPSLPPGSGGILITDEQAKAVGKLADFGTTVVQETGQLARYVGKVLGTAPEDAVGIVLGDPLRFVRTAIAAKLDEWLTRILRSRNVSPEPVSPSLAIPLLRAAYDESRPELQELWAQLIAAAMDPARSSRVRRSFIDTLQRFDPLDALVLKARRDISGNPSPNARDYLASRLQVQFQEIEISTQNLLELKCVHILNNDYTSFNITFYGHGLLRACSD